MAKQPMTDWQKFALLIFAIAAVAIVVFAWVTIRGDINSML